MDPTGVIRQVSLVSAGKRRGEEMRLWRKAGKERRGEEKIHEREGDRRR